MALKLGDSQQTICAYLKQLGKMKKLDKWVSHELSEKQMFRRLEVCSSLLSRNETDPFLDRIVTVDEKWVLYDNRQRSWHWLDSDEPPKNFPSRSSAPEKDNAHGFLVPLRHSSFQISQSWTVDHDGQLLPSTRSRHGKTVGKKAGIGEQTPGHSLTG
ncbi:hypothetical protein M513_12541 [Trichuris suis]|uniref:Histone-lysine N-methyltransferase SETMAR-like n=1 Tax=Trichuris suis TaxID=68888 RepID=A0A085LNL6_9BILA|nr:hypothetical protein M513_12541 [Trichuris suis]